MVGFCRDWSQEEWRASSWQKLAGWIWGPLEPLPWRHLAPHPWGPLAPRPPSHPSPDETDCPPRNSVAQTGGYHISIALGLQCAVHYALLPQASRETASLIRLRASGVHQSSKILADNESNWATWANKAALFANARLSSRIFQTACSLWWSRSICITAGETVPELAGCLHGANHLMSTFVGDVLTELVLLCTLSQSVSRLHLFQPPRADQMSDSDCQSQHRASHPYIHKWTWRHSQDHPARRTAPWLEPQTILDICPE